MGKRLISEIFGVYSINDQRKPGKRLSLLRIDSGSSMYCMYVQVRIPVWRMSDSKDDLQHLCAELPAIIVINTIF